jgi:8-oxo-dGTP pyrophosphatase MutT (NUDIX family)
MYELRVLCRVVTYDPATHSILLVRNRDQKWWCAPGGGWDHAQETILECAKREAFEETGVQVNIVKLLYVQTLHIKKQNSIWLEQFWLAEPPERKTPFPFSKEIPPPPNQKCKECFFFRGCRRVREAVAGLSWSVQISFASPRASRVRH